MQPFPLFSVEAQIAKRKLLKTFELTEDCKFCLERRAVTQRLLAFSHGAPGKSHGKVSLISHDMPVPGRILHFGDYRRCTPDFDGGLRRERGRRAREPNEWEES
jgi:hypothetical protein